MARMAQEQMSREDPEIFQKENQEGPKPLKKEREQRLYDGFEKGKKED